MTRPASPQDNWQAKQLGRWMRDLAARLNWGTVTWNPPNVPGNTTVDTTLTTTDGATLTGLRPGMAVTVSPPAAINAGLVVTAWVPTDDELTVRLGNVTAGGINPASGVWSFFAVLT